MCNYVSIPQSHLIFVSKSDVDIFSSWIYLFWYNCWCFPRLVIGVENIILKSENVCWEHCIDLYTKDSGSVLLDLFSAKPLSNLILKYRYWNPNEWHQIMILKSRTRRVATILILEQIGKFKYFQLVRNLRYWWITRSNIGDSSLLC